MSQAATKKYERPEHLVEGCERADQLLTRYPVRKVEPIEGRPGQFRHFHASYARVQDLRAGKPTPGPFAFVLRCPTCFAAMVYEVKEPTRTYLGFCEHFTEDSHWLKGCLLEDHWILLDEEADDAE